MQNALNLWFSSGLWLVCLPSSYSKSWSLLYEKAQQKKIKSFIFPTCQQNLAILFKQTFYYLNKKNSFQSIQFSGDRVSMIYISLAANDCRAGESVFHLHLIIWIITLMMLAHTGCISRWIISWWSGGSTLGRIMVNMSLILKRF